MKIFLGKVIIFLQLMNSKNSVFMNRFFLLQIIFLVSNQKISIYFQSISDDSIQRQATLFPGLLRKIMQGF